MISPRQPENIRLVLDDDVEVSATCSYDGVKDDVHLWITRVPNELWGRIKSAKIETMPPKTTLSFVQDTDAPGGE